MTEENYAELYLYTLDPKFLSLTQHQQDALEHFADDLHRQHSGPNSQSSSMLVDKSKFVSAAIYAIINAPDEEKANIIAGHVR